MRPVFWSSSYFVREPRGISTRTSTLRSWLPLLTLALPCVLCRRHDHRDLAFRALGSIVPGKGRCRAADDLFVDLRHLARHRDGRVGRDRSEVGEQVTHAIRALIDDERSATREELGELAAARAALLLGEAHEGELACRQPRRDERGDGRRGPGHRDDFVPSRDRRGDELLARVGEGRRARIRYERHVPAAVHLANKLRGLTAVIELRVARQVLRADVVLAEKELRVPRVLARDHVNVLQDPQRTQGNILEVADRRGDEIELAYGRMVTARKTGTS